MTQTEFLSTQIENTQGGDPWYGPPIARVVEGLSAREAAAHPIPGAHSIWEIILHMTAWVREVRRRLERGDARMPEDGDWPALPEPTEGNWWQSLDELAGAHGELREAVHAFPEQKLDQPVGPARDAPLGTGVSYQAMLQGLLQHDAYHLGQVALLKRALRIAPAGG